MMVVTNFNQLSIGFHVSSVLGIHRVSWENITKPDVTLNTNGAGVATGIIKLAEKLIIILDFEKIVADVCPATSLKIEEVKNLGPRQRNAKPIVIAEDSPMLERLIKDCLEEAGYTNLSIASNGQEAWDILEGFKASGSIEDKVACVITDIEMPKMDGHRLTKLIKTDADLKELPVIIFSSLVNDEMRRKGESLGASAQISKPEIGILVETLDKYLF